MPAAKWPAKLALALSLILLPVVSPRGDDAATQMRRMIGAGTQTRCGAWLEARRTRQSFGGEAWALGYISGAAIWGDVGNPLVRTDADGVFYWLENHCRAHATDRFVDAINAFIESH